MEMGKGYAGWRWGRCVQDGDEDGVCETKMGKGCVRWRWGRGI